jgi:hypothetical protein
MLWLFAFHIRLDTYQAKLKRAICFVVLVQTEFSNLTGIEFGAIEPESSKLREKIREWNIDYVRFVNQSVEISPIINSPATPSSIRLQLPSVTTSVSLNLYSYSSISGQV